MQLRTHSLPLLNVAKNGSRVGVTGALDFCLHGCLSANREIFFLFLRDLKIRHRRLHVQSFLLLVQFIEEFPLHTYVYAMFSRAEFFLHP